MSYISSDLSGIASFKCCSWSYFDNICAVILSDGSVHFYNDIGNELYPNTIIRNSKATSLAFSPHENVLAIGWQDGKVSVWNQGTAISSSHTMLYPITVLCWHPQNSLLISGADNGGINCWDCSSMIIPFIEQYMDTQVTHVAWCSSESLNAFFVTADGHLFSFDCSAKTINNVFDLPVPVLAFATSNSTRRLLSIGGDNVLTQFSYPPSLSKVSQVKLQSGGEPSFVKIRPDVFAYSISDSVTVWNIQSDESIILRTQNSQKVMTVSFNAISAKLYATTDNGLIYVWQSTMKGLLSRQGWTNPLIYDTKMKLDQALFSPFTFSFISLSASHKPFVNRYLPTQTCISHDFVVWQSDTNEITISGQSPSKVISPIERISISKSYILIVSPSSSEVYTIRGGGISPISPIQTKTVLSTIIDESLYCCQNNTLEIRNLQGIVKQTTTLGTMGIINFMCSNGKFICMMCSDYSVFLFDVSRRTPTLQFSSVFSINQEKFRIRNISSSFSGFCISVSIDIYEDSQWKPSPFLYLHSSQFDKTITVDFESRVPIQHFWDSEDPRLLCVQAIPYGPNYESAMSGGVIVPLYVSDSMQVYRQTPLTLQSTDLICGVELPRVYYIRNDIIEREAPSSQVLPQFEGLDSAGYDGRKSLMELNFHLATGDIDSAFNSIRGISNKSIWRSLAQMCAQMRRIDLVDLCFGQMEDGASAILLHKTKMKDNDEAAALCLVDAQLGLYSEAKKAAVDTRRFDYLAKTHQALGEWSDAMSTVTVNDRIHLKSMAYQYARSLEIKGELVEAISKYESAGVIQNELPRLSLQANDLKLFFSYISERAVTEIHPKLLAWIGHFYEAHQIMESAMEYYEDAKSISDQVRLLCLMGKWDDASKLVLKSNQRSVICLFARLLIKRIQFYSKQENVETTVDVEKLKHDVITLYRKARQFAQAMEFALEYEMINDILALSFSAPSPIVCKAAQWFESQNEHKNAILLYSRCGKMNRALALCFVAKQYDALDEISDTLNSKTDPNVLLRCGQYFIESGRWSKAAQCFALAKQIDIVIQLCNEHNIKVSSSVIQELAENESDPELIKRFAALCEQQGMFQLSAQLYIKLKDHLSAMKSLIRSGDATKIIKFAKLVRKRETFILAANYLMTLNPRDNDSNFEIIVSMYSSAQSFDKLARFYEASAQLEIDEYQEYGKGHQLLQKAISVLNSANNIQEKERLIETLSTKVKLIEVYLEAARLVKTDPQKSQAYSMQLLKTKGIETVMRPDDIYILLVQCYVTQGNYPSAYKLLEELRNNGTDITWFMEVEAIQKIYAAVGQTFIAPSHDNGDYDSIDDGDIDDIE